MIVLTLKPLVLPLGCVVTLDVKSVYIILFNSVSSSKRNWERHKEIMGHSCDFDGKHSRTGKDGRRVPTVQRRRGSGRCPPLSRSTLHYRPGTNLVTDLVRRRGTQVSVSLRLDQWPYVFKDLSSSVKFVVRLPSHDLTGDIYWDAWTVSSPIHVRHGWCNYWSGFRKG